MVIMIALPWCMVTGDSLAAWHLAVTGSDVVFHNTAAGDQYLHCRTAATSVVL